MAKLELMAPAGSMESLRAAVLSGADAVYLGAGKFNARQNAKNFSRAQLCEAVSLCHRSGVKLALTLNTLVSDRETKDYLADAAFANEIGVDAVIVQDLGMLRLLRRSFPDLPLYGSTQMTVCDRAGVAFAAKMGCSRVVLARELSLAEIAEIASDTPIELEVFAHGALCMSYSGQCYLSAALGGTRSANRGLCAQPCRLPYGVDGGKPTDPLSLKDLCVAPHLQQLADAGVTALKIEGRMKRPEYVALVTSIYSRLLRTGGMPTASDMARLELIFSREGFTSDYLAGQLGPQMFGTHAEQEESAAYRALVDSIAQELTHLDLRRNVKLDAVCTMHLGEPAGLTLQDPDGNRVTVTGQQPQAARSRATTVTDWESQLSKTGGTPYFIRSVEGDLQEGAMLPLSALNELRRAAFEQLDRVRTAPPKRRALDPEPLPRQVARTAPPDFAVEVLDLSQISREMLSMRPIRVYAPIEQICDSLETVKLCEKYGVELCAALPRSARQRDTEILRAMLCKLREWELQTALCTNIGQFALCREAGLLLRGDYSLNIFNSAALLALHEEGLLSATLSFELNCAQIRDLNKYIPCEILAYGRLPLMLTQNCVIPQSAPGCDKCKSGHTLTDRKGSRLLICRAWGCCNEIENAHPLYLSDKLPDFSKLGLSALRLRFTDENPRQAANLFSAYLAAEPVKLFTFTRGLYYKGVQ